MAEVSSPSVTAAIDPPPRRGWLPRGGALPPHGLQRRHDAIVALLWCHAPALGALAIGLGLGWRTAVLHTTVLAGFATLAGLSRPGMGARSVLATLGLLTAGALLVHQSDGQIEAHFHFFVIIVIVSLYHAWSPFLAGILFVLLHHGVVSTLWPDAVFAHEHGRTYPWLWAAVHSGALVAQYVVAMLSWRFSEDALRGEADALARSRQAGRALLAAQRIASIGSWEHDLRSGRTWWSTELHRLVGTDPSVDRIDRWAFLELVHPGDRDQVRVRARAAIAGEDTLELRCRLVRTDGVQLTVRLRGELDIEREQVFVGTCQDVTDEERLRAEVEHRAMHDPLTDLGNRARFLDRADNALARRQRHGGELAVLFLDLDRFKQVNDSHGHAVGDRILVEVAERLAGTVRAADTLARLGGDEFAILLDGGGIEPARRLARRVISVIAQPMTLDGRTVRVRCSVGIAVADGHVDGHALLRDADVAMYAAKQSAETDVEEFAPSMLIAAIDEAGWFSELEAAVGTDQLQVHYQPMVRLEDGEVYGVEALLRWHHPEHGQIAPATFIPIAERSGVILRLGRFVIDRACADIVGLRRRSGRDLVVSVNVSAQQVGPALVDEVQATLARHGLPPCALVLELTETSVLVEDAATNSCLRRLRALGVTIAIDDFGTGYSSLSYLRSLPVDVLKVDRSFIDPIGRDAHSRALVRTIIELAQALDLHTVAEGIETDGHAQVLGRLGCVFGQGYLFARPAPIDEVARFLDEPIGALD